MTMTDHAVQITAATTAAVSGVAMMAAERWTMGFLGIPISVLLAGFVGAAGVLAFLPAVSRGRAFGTVLLCALAGAYAGPVAAAHVAWLAGGERLVAIAAAAILQVAIPMVIEHRLAIAAWAARRFGGGS